MQIRLSSFFPFIGAVGILAAGSAATAQTFVGTILATRGDVKVLHTPNPNDPGPFLQIEGVKFAFEEGKIGKKVNPGEVIQCGADGKAKIVYPNGDAFFIGNGSSLMLPNVSENKDGKESVIKLFYGRLRSLISKTGPRNKLRVTTPDAVAGVRGTDFFTRANPSVGTQLTVLRGEVAIQGTAAPASGATANAPTPETQSVKTGFMAQADSKATAAPKVSEATQEELTLLQTESAIHPEKKDLEGLPPTQRKELVQLDQKAKAAVLADIKTEDPALYEQLRKDKNVNVDVINASVVDRLFKVAPHEKKKKPSKDDLESSGQGVYDKYYNNDKSKTSN